jgi:hypothetical protein
VCAVSFDHPTLQSGTTKKLQTPVIACFSMILIRKSAKVGLGSGGFEIGQIAFSAGGLSVVTCSTKDREPKPVSQRAVFAAINDSRNE